MNMLTESAAYTTAGSFVAATVVSIVSAAHLLSVRFWVRSKYIAEAVKIVSVIAVINLCMNASSQKLKLERKHSR